VGESVPRLEAWDKVTGRARYTADHLQPGLLRAALVTSTHAHALLRRVDTAPAAALPGVRAVVTGADTSLLCGEVIEDRPPLARGRVRHYGEPVALVVADSAAEAAAAARAVGVEYEALPYVGSPAEALREGAPLVHPDLGTYRIAQRPACPEPGTNVADRARLRRGDAARGFAESEVVVEASFTLPQVDHAAMETRAARVEVQPDGRVLVHAATQAPFEVQKTLATYFGIPQGRVVVTAPLVGGAFGGKAAVQLEVLAYLASRAVGGRPVLLANTREQDLTSSPVGIGLESTCRLGARRDGTLLALDATHRMDIGAYADSTPRIARALASACTGPYRVPHVRCDVLCVYTNHVFATAFRGFGYMPMTFTIERLMDRLACALGLDPLELRLRNAIRPGDSGPTQVRFTEHLIGDLPRCIERARALIGWERGVREELPDGRVRSRGAACFWKTSSSPPNAISGAIAALNADGSVNLSVGAVELGPGTKTAAAQMLAERLGIPVAGVHVRMEVNTHADPEHWKTVASMSTFMVGRAVLAAADDILKQLRGLAAVALRCPPEDLEVRPDRVCLRDDPEMFVRLSDLAHGFRYPDGDSIGGQIVGCGGFVMRHLTLLDSDDGRGMPGPSWTVGCQAVEVELDPGDCSYRILRAVTVMDVGRVVNPRLARGQVMGGMCQGLGYGSRERVAYGADGAVLSDQFRTYRTMRIGEQPAYAVEFVETPQANAPFGARPLGEHGILAAPAALAAALATAAQVDVTCLPATPEALWRAREASR
jgi:CO/xanthine dehydrogenase Mo-binding subunit